MSATLDSLAQQGRRIAEFEHDSPAPTSELAEDADGRRYLLWKGPQSWVERIDALFDAGGHFTALPRPIHRRQSPDEPDKSSTALLLECPTDHVELFDIWKWRNLDALSCVQALQKLAATLKEIHDAGWTLDGLQRSELLQNPRSGELVIATMPRLCHLDDEKETIWRDIRIFAELAYQNFLEHDYPGGHQLVSLLQDRSAMADTGLNAPGLPQLLAGCVTPYGDLAYGDVDDLIEGLDNLHIELVRPLAYQVGSRSTQGNHIFRQNNQDSCGHVVVDTTCGSRKMRLGFFCVADGIGGIDDGERASSLAVETACSAFLRAWNRHGGQPLHEHPTAFARAIARVTSQRLTLEGSFAPEQNRGGTTFTGLLLAGDRAGICHIGDSRATLIRDSRPIPLTRDHTLASIYEKLGESASSDGKDAASHRTIARFLSTGTELDWRRIDGITDTLQLSSEQRAIGGFYLQRGDIFVLTSDGAHGEVSEAELMRMVPLHRDDPQKLCEAIVDRSLQKIGRDNATAVVISVR